MGALTESRKRCFDLYLPQSPHPITPPSKKLKLQPQLPALNQKPVSFPPPAPLSRQIHGPQRTLRVFNLGSSNRTSLVKRSLFRMGNFGSKLFKSKKEEGFGLENYRNVVEDSGYKKVERDFGSKLGLGSVQEISPPSSDSEEVKVLNRKVVNARRVVEESVEAREDKYRERRRPIYKKLYEQARKRDRRLSDLGFEAKLTEEKLSAIQGCRVQEKAKEDPHGLFSPLTDEEIAEVSHAFCSGNRRELLVTHKASNIEITREVLQCLIDGAWLNDEVINLYLELLKERERREPKKFLNCHFFNTFFYKRLISGRNGYDYNAVRRWTTQRKLGYSLIECDKIFVPIHKDVHWCLAVINTKDETFQYLDSLGGMDTNVLRVLAKYMMDEVRNKNNKQINTTSWKQEIVDDLPLQENMSDCGMFMLKYTDFYSRGLGLWFCQTLLP
ncbi:ubiquitin-like-specific protease ESD4 isoform X2 [Asparagus officinalis]|uniref:ubiquitin-like-specific protease ESD4 isoform X2 n=1 Tax=Asparagus officinalis TaxID=4686 RepID=UPI00098E63E1|nr:ubiquitin-like-specific protease ESD4 isoform X2 [Asparagus officinalis]